VDIYTVIARIIMDSLAIANGTLRQMINLPANSSGPLDPNITLTNSGVEFVNHIAAAAAQASSILCDTLEALF